MEEIKIQEIVSSVENQLLTNPKIKFDFDKKWSSNFSEEPGVYAVFNKDKMVYVGESANLKERMKEVKRTYNHSFRRKLGKHLYPDSIIAKGKFPPDIEEALNKYYIQNIYFTFVVVSFGRLEIESRLMHKYKNEGILNSIGKRNRIALI